MTANAQIELVYHGGVIIDKEVTYYGDSLEEIARTMDRDNNELLEYMMTHDDKGHKAFCFGGFMFEKAGLIAAQMRDSIF